MRRLAAADQHQNPSATVDKAGRAWPTAMKALGLGSLGAVLLWAAFPPVNWPLMAWVAPVAWLWPTRDSEPLGWKAYVAFWMAGTFHWLLMLEGIRLAHPALYAGWIALAAYLGVYLPVFVGLTRVAVHGTRWSPIIAAPVVWIGLELARGHLITGFSMGLLAHTQAEFPRLIQISDLAGGYTLSFVIMLIAACCTRIAWGPRCWWPLLPAGAAIAATLVYGQWRISQTQPGASGPVAKVALIQGSLDTVFEVSPERMRETFDHYRGLTNEAVGTCANLDLVLWPESMFVMPETVVEEPLTAPPESPLNVEEMRRRLVAAQEDFATLMAGEAARANTNSEVNHSGTKLLVGTTSLVYGSGRLKIFNAALLADRSGKIEGRYYKTHPVMFGEYIPFGEALPWIYRLTPMSGGLSSGEGPTVFDVAGLKMSPSICFESTIPHLIRDQLGELARRGTPADVLVNVTNDGWFWGTGMLDLHFRCGVFRAVENRQPMIVVANTGISTLVDGNGVVQQRGSKRQPEVILTEVHADGRTSPYATIGDWPALLCVIFCGVLAVIGWRGGRRK